RGRHEAAGDRLAGKTIREMTAMADIDLQPLVEGGLDDGMHLALAVDEATGVTRERMGENVAGAQQRNPALEDGIDVLAVGAAGRQSPELTEMNINRQIGAAADPAPNFDEP